MSFMNKEISQDESSTDIFTTITDKRGTITYVNPGFCQISGYSASELIGKPHSIIRNDNMPKCLFHLFWEKLKANKPVCIYILNRTKNGDDVWLLTLVVPSVDGFISMRVSADAEKLSEISTLYHELTELEKNEPVSEVADKFLCKIAEMGHQDLDSYSQSLLEDQILRRPIKDDLVVSSRLPGLKELSVLIEGLNDTATELSTGFKHIRSEPVNMRILSNRLDSSGASISMISQNYDMMAREMCSSLDRLCTDETNSLKHLRELSNKGYFSVLSSVLIGATQRGFSKSDTDPVKEEWSNLGQDQINQLMRSNEKQVKDDISDIVRASNGLPDISRQLRRRINGLDVVKLLCRVENCRIGSRDSGLTGIIERLETFHCDADGMLSELSKKAIQISQRARSLL